MKILMAILMFLLSVVIYKLTQEGSLSLFVILYGIFLIIDFIMNGDFEEAHR